MRWFRNLALAATAVTLAACGGSAVRYVAAGPAIAHGEGHIVFASS